MNTPSSTQLAFRSRASLAAVQDLTSLLEKTAGLTFHLSTDGSTFSSDGPGKTFVSAHGTLVDDARIVVELELVRAPGHVRVPSQPFFEHLSSLGERVHLLPPRKAGSSETSLWVELQVQALPLTPARTGPLLDQLKALAALAEGLQAAVPTPVTDADLQSLYAPVSEYLAPVPPWYPEAGTLPEALEAWTSETLDYLMGSVSVALAAPEPAVADFLLALLAGLCREQGTSLGRLTRPAVSARGVMELCEKAPGLLTVPAVALNLGSNRYDVESEVPTLLKSLPALGTAAVFTGLFSELQDVFQGGQGGHSEPLSPVIRHAPDVPQGLLVRHAVWEAATMAGGAPQQAEEALAALVEQTLEGLPRGQRKRLLPGTVRYATHAWARSGSLDAGPVSAFAARLSGQTATFAGLSDRPRAVRTPAVQERFTRRLTDPGLLPFLAEHLLAQDEALADLVNRLRTECLTRPAHQPLRYAAQGTPGTGKSASAVLLARWLGIPYVNIDAASMPDHHTASSQLLGSGRGIVGSHQRGRLEQFASHHAGVLIELSDIDHAPLSVRSTLTDVFLQMLETGEAQSSKGAMFGCQNIILAVTMNLPDGRDEQVRRGMGFASPTGRDVRQRVAAEIRAMLSGAFLSRIGQPVLFAPLDGPTVARIVERGVEQALRTAADRLGLGLADVVLGAEVGPRLTASLEADPTASGARLLLEHARTEACLALLNLLHGASPSSGQTLYVHADPRGTLTLTTQPA